MNKLSVALFTAVLSAAMVMPNQVYPAFAGIRSDAISSTLTVSTGTVKVFGSATQTFTNPSVGNPLILAVEKNTVQGFFIQNNGDLSTPAFRLQINLPTKDIVSLNRCDAGVLFSATPGVCASGPTTAIPITKNTLTTVASLLAPNTFFNLELVVDAKTTATINLSVLTSQLGTRTINS